MTSLSQHWKNVNPVKSFINIPSTGSISQLEPRPVPPPSLCALLFNSMYTHHLHLSTYPTIDQVTGWLLIQCDTTFICLTFDFSILKRSFSTIETNANLLLFSWNIRIIIYPIEWRFVFHFSLSTEIWMNVPHFSRQLGELITKLSARLLIISGMCDRLKKNENHDLVFQACTSWGSSSSPTKPWDVSVVLSSLYVLLRRHLGSQP